MLHVRPPSRAVFAKRYPPGSEASPEAVSRKSVQEVIDAYGPESVPAQLDHRTTGAWPGSHAMRRRRRCMAVASFASPCPREQGGRCPG